ncbi:MAG: cyclase family protein [Pseudomonadota bacterium]|nr:cyclase family protein [Pseudomonadota bacterium]
MARRIVDLSVPLANDIPADPPIQIPSITYLGHKATLSDLLGFFPGLKTEDLPDGEGWAVEKVTISTHNGTHLDAPWHYASTMDHGERAITIDEVPLDWCYQPGVKLDFRHFPAGYVATAADVEAELSRIGHTLSPLEIVVINTAAGMRFGEQDYVASGCGMGHQATMYLLDRGVRVTGTDGWSWDAPFVHTAKKYAQTKDASLIWEGHKAGRHTGYCHIEKLHNLEQLPSTGFVLSCFPVKIERASAGWTRAVAIVDG